MRAPADSRKCMWTAVQDSARLAWTLPHGRGPTSARRVVALGAKSRPQLDAGARGTLSTGIQAHSSPKAGAAGKSQKPGPPATAR